MGEQQVNDDVQVRQNAGDSRYEIFVDGELAGFTQYALDGDRADFVHTEIDERYSGHGLASRLIQAALDDARGKGWAVLPYCRFVTRFIGKHAEYRDLVPADQRARFGLNA
jgi:predicted GNAT family acetyltransferase